MTNKTGVSPSTQARLLARHLRQRQLASLTHAQALEAVAHLHNAASYNVLLSQESRSADAKALVRRAIRQGLTFAQALELFAEKRTALEMSYVQAARANFVEEGELEIDDNAIVSLSEDGGAYVMAWQWVSQADLPALSARPQGGVDPDIAGLELVLRKQGFEEADLDELVHDTLAPEQAAWTNNQGLYEQLLVLKQAEGSTERLTGLLQRTLEDFDARAPAVFARAFSADVETVDFDALPWLLQADESTLGRLVADSRGALGNCDLGDEVVLWSEKHGRHHPGTGGRDDRTALRAFLKALRMRARLKPELAGVTLNIEVSDMLRFVEHFGPGPRSALAQALLDGAL